MVDERDGFDLRRDGGGLLLFGAGAFLGVLSILALFSSVPPEEATGTSALALWWTALLGAFPSLLLAAAAAVLGARAFLAGRSDGTGRVLLGTLGLALGCAVALSSFSAGAGGLVGDLLGGTLARVAHPVLGLVLGVLVLAATARLGFPRELSLLTRASAQAPARERAPAPAAEPALESAPERAAARSSERAPRAESVSVEEAQALLPERREPAPEPPSPYPEDVRLRGQVPEGARPIPSASAPRHAESVSEHEAAALALGLPAGVPEVAAKVPTWRPQPARTKPEEDRLEVELDEELERELEARPSRAQPRPLARAPEPELEPEADEHEPLQAQAQAPRGPAEALPLEERESNAPPPPSWEQSSLFEEEPPVDAYGTPLELVEQLVGHDAHAGPRNGTAFEELEDDLEEEAEDSAGVLTAEVVLELEPELEPELEDELEEELDEELEDEEDEESEDELEEDEQALDDEELEEAEDEQESEAAELEEAELDEESEAPALERAAAPSPEAPRCAPTLPLARAEEPEEPELVEDVPALSQAELAPQPMPAGELERRLAGRPKLLFEAGQLFLARGRVAVSMLQREYGMTFDDACTVLDELQQMGLIGPYLGGKHRDILLTSEEWLERVASS